MPTIRLIVDKGHKVIFTENNWEIMNISYAS